jgi:hypothetical protein
LTTPLAAILLFELLPYLEELRRGYRALVTADLRRALGQ